MHNILRYTILIWSCCFFPSCSTLRWSWNGLAFALRRRLFLSSGRGDDSWSFWNPCNSFRNFRCWIFRHNTWCLHRSRLTFEGWLFFRMNPWKTQGRNPNHNRTSSNWELTNTKNRTLFKKRLSHKNLLLGLTIQFVSAFLHLRTLTENHILTIPKK